MHLETILMGIALSMDAFSLAIVYGTLSLKMKSVITLSIIVGLFHFFMPLLGYFFGDTILNYITINPHVLMSIIFIIIGIEMVSSLNKEDINIQLTNILSFLLFGLTVSMDSLSIGIGLSAIHNNIINSGITFCLISGVTTFLGLILGKKLSKMFGNISTLIGSIILFGLGIYYFFC